jgi:hypothetical protein
MVGCRRHGEIDESSVHFGCLYSATDETASTLCSFPVSKGGSGKQAAKTVPVAQFGTRTRPNLTRGKKLHR